MIGPMNNASLVRSMAAMLVLASGASSLALAQDKPAATPAPDSATYDFTPVRPYSPTGPIGPVEESKDRWTLSIGGRAQHAFQADLDDSAGEVGVTRAGADVALLIPVGDKLRISTGLDFEASFYDWDSPDDVVPGSGSRDPWDEIYSVTLSLSATYLLDDKWSLFGGGFVNSSGESGADFSDTITGGGFLGVGYSFTPDLTIQGGIGVRTRLEDDERIFPVIGVQWKIDEQFSLRTEGPGLRVTYAASDEWSFYLRGAYEDREFRLADDNSTVRDGVVRDQSVPIGLGVEWRPTGGLSVGLEAGAIVWQEYDIQSSSGRTLNEIETDPTPYIGLRVDYRF